MLLQVSALTILFSLLPLILDVSLDAATAWRYALAAYGIVHAVDVSSFLLKMTGGTQFAFKVCGSIGVVARYCPICFFGLAWTGWGPFRRDNFTTNLISKVEKSRLGLKGRD